MNKSFFIGIIVVVALVYFGVIHPAKAPKMYVDPHAIVLVVGGTLAAGLIAFRGTFFLRLLDFAVWGMLFRRERRFLKAANDLLKVRKNFVESKSFKDDESYEPFLREGGLLLFDEQVKTHYMVEILETRSNYFFKKYSGDAKILVGLGKYPPAFGLLGASTGMIEMMQNLGPGGSQGIGQAMAVALVATFWGIGLANLVILPLADSAMKNAQEDNQLRQFIIGSLKLIRLGQSEQNFRRYLRSFLSLEERKELVSVSGGFDTPSQVRNMGTVKPFQGVANVKSDDSTIISAKEETTVDFPFKKVD
jgi:chemotaxis protein MotA